MKGMMVECHQFDLLYVPGAQCFGSENLFFLYTKAMAHREIAIFDEFPVH